MKSGENVSNFTAQNIYVPSFKKCIIYMSLYTCTYYIPHLYMNNKDIIFWCNTYVIYNYLVYRELYDYFIYYN